MMSTLSTEHNTFFTNMDTSHTQYTTDNDSICSDPSFFSEINTNKSDTSVSNLLSVLSPKANANKSRQSTVALNKVHDDDEKVVDTNEKQKQSLVSFKNEDVDKKLFEMKLQEAIKTEMENLQNKLEKKYGEEFEKNENEINELIAAHAFAKKAHDQIHKQLECMRAKYQNEVVKLSPFERLLSHIFTV